VATDTAQRRSASENGRRRARALREAENETGADRQSVPLDMLLTEASLGPGQRWIPGVAGVKAAAKLAVRPQKVARRGARLAAELAKIALGRSEVAPSKGDRRFKDPAWLDNPAFKRLGQSYLATAETIDEVLCDAELDWAEERRVRFAWENLVDLVAPSNFPPTNPAVWKATIDSGGGNFVKGLRHLASDMSSPPRIPSMVDKSAFEVGKDVAATEGAVVHRTEVFELLQYQPQTDKVRELPLLVVPPMINKYYVTDMAPGRSMVEYLVKGGQQVLAISWRNPDERFSDWDLDTYVGAVIEAIEAAEKITRSEQVHTLGLCAGGITLSTAVAHLAAKGEQDRVAGMTLGVCVLDNENAGTMGALSERRLAELAMADSARRGYLDGRQLAGVFAWLRPNDLIWNYWINNYLLGKEPPAFDVLYWNADTTNLPAALHRDFVELSLENSLVEPGKLEALGTPIDLSKITTDTYLVAGIADHITPWQNCYRSTQLLGSEPRFVLSTSGHIAAMVNPPGNEKASFRVNEQNPESADDWLKEATQTPGTWWDDWAEWLSTRSGDEKNAPRKVGRGRKHKALDPAPGKYVLEQA
jgi:polyhydroxyalkanoate synthase